MQPINVDDKLHTEVKLLAVKNHTNMYKLANRLIEVGLWYASLKGEQKDIIDKQVDKFLTDKSKNG